MTKYELYLKKIQNSECLSKSIKHDKIFDWLHYYAEITGGHRSLSSDEKIMFGIIYSEGFCTYPNSYFMDVLGISKNTVTKCLNYLITEGLVCKIQREYGGRTLVINTEMVYNYMLKYENMTIKNKELGLMGVIA